VIITAIDADVISMPSKGALLRPFRDFPARAQTNGRKSNTSPSKAFD